jgi:hypothetical protein
LSGRWSAQNTQILFWADYNNLIDGNYPIENSLFDSW